MFRDLVPARDPQVHSPLPHKCRDVRGGQEDQREWEVLDESNVEARLASELDVAAFEEGEGGLLESSFCTTTLEIERESGWAGM